MGLCSNEMGMNSLFFGTEFVTTAMAGAPQPKRQKFDLRPSAGSLSWSAAKNERNSASIRSSEVSGALANSSETDLRIQQAKKNAVAQAVQDGCTGILMGFVNPNHGFQIPASLYILGES